MNASNTYILRWYKEKVDLEVDPHPFILMPENVPFSLLDHATLLDKTGTGIIRERVLPPVHNSLFETTEATVICLIPGFCQRLAEHQDKE